MNTLFRSTILKSTGADAIASEEVLQSLWKGYGEIRRITLAGGACRSVIAKHIHFPVLSGKDKKSAGVSSHQRKLKSYNVEAAWYNRWSRLCTNECRVPACLAVAKQKNDLVIVLEDLDTAGYPRRSSDPSWAEMTAGLQWLAEFHATFMGIAPEDLWKVGTYWHLDTRPDELKALSDPSLRSVAGRIDMQLKKTIQTIVHGDAKLQNFCFTENGSGVAAVDFQYTGGGCGMKDVAYFAASCVHEDECARWEDDILDTYFTAMAKAMTRRNSSVDPATVEAAWRPLYHLAWVDFHRFYKGWSGYRFPKEGYSERLSRKVIDQFY